MTEVATTHSTGLQLLSDIRFGACEIKVVRREIYLEGRLQILSRRAFDMLLQLIRHRDEVITKAVLFQSLWGGRPASDKLLAKIVVQIRQAIGDEASAPRWLKTVHGVGYRFIGELDLPLVPQGGSLAVGSQVRLALLPLENRTGQPHFVWIELGLATLIGQALTTDSRIIVVPVTTVLRALDGVPAHATAEERAAIVASVVGASCVVQATLRREVELRLEFKAFGSAYLAINGVLFDDDAVHLGELLAQRLASALTADMAPVVRFENDDPFFNQLLSHATRLSTQRQWRTAIQFLEPALVLAPRSWPARMLLLRALVQCADGRAFKLADELLAEPQAEGNERRQGEVHEAVAALVIRRDFLMARRHLEQALQLGERHPDDDWAMRTRLVAAVDSVWRGDIPAGLRHFEWLQQAHRSSGDLPALSMVDMNFAASLIQMHDLAAAQGLLEDMCCRFEMHGWASLHMQALGKLAYVHAALGKTTLAWQLLGRAELLSQTVQDELLIASLLDSTTPLLGDMRAARPMDRLLGRWQHLMLSDQPLVRGVYLMTLAEREACYGNITAAREAMQTATALAFDMAYPFYIASWSTRRLLLELQSADWICAREIRSVLSQQPQTWQDDEVQAWLLHAEAAELHANVDHRGALDRLLLATRRAKAGRAQACSALAAAWLHIEQGHADEATRLLGSVDPFPHQHPIGIAIAARIAYAAGDFVGAVILQRRYSTLVGAHRPKAMADILSIYEAAIANDSAGHLAPGLLPGLITLLPA